MRLAKASESLTATEARVLGLVSESKTNREIALILGISRATVKRHIENILRKLRLRSRVEAAVYSLSMAGCHASENGDCPLVAWRKWHESGRIGRLTDYFFSSPP